MIFIKNCTKELENKNISLALTENGNKVTLDILINRETEESETFNIVTSELEGINASMVKAIEYIGNATNYLHEYGDGDAKMRVVPLLDNKPTEVGFYVTGVKTVLKVEDTPPATIVKYDDEAESTNHYPRDMIVFILPNKIDDKVADYKLVVDRRNLGAPTMTSVGKHHTILIMYAKWTIWSKLKFPAYAYIEPKFEDDTTAEPIVSFKLGYTSNKNIKRNQLVFVDNKEAKDYLIESFRILREKRDKRNNENGGYKSNKYRQNKGNNDNRRPYKSNGTNGKDKKYRNNKVYK